MAGDPTRDASHSELAYAYLESEQQEKAIDLLQAWRDKEPAWRWSKPSRALIGAGVGLYDLLSYDRNRHAPKSLHIPHPRWMGRKHLMDKVPWLDPEGLQGAWAYHDTLNIHPERLLLAYVKSAAADGAIFLTHTKLNDGLQSGSITHDKNPRLQRDEL